MDDLELREHARLTRLCARISHDPDAAEDLAQETLAIGWRRRDTLRDPERRADWLDGIARNVCRRWLRRRLGEAAVGRLGGEPDGGSAAPEPLDDFDVEVELERADLARLLDRAMALLPAATRTVLVDRFVHELPQAEIARRLGTTEGAVEARVQRGKLLLRRLLEEEFAEEAEAYGLVGSERRGWHETRVWCPLCARRRLLARFDPRDGSLTSRCPDCCPGPGHLLVHGGDVRLFRGVTAFRPAMNRLMREMAGWVDTRGDPGTIRCSACGGRMPWRVGAMDRGVPPGLIGRTSVVARCPRCRDGVDSMLAGYVLATREGQAFWQTQARMVFAPERVVEAAGGPALVAGVRTPDGASRVDAVISLTTLRPIEVVRRG